MNDAITTEKDFAYTITVEPYVIPKCLCGFKLGRYVEELGPLNNPKTNQRLYKIDNLGFGGFKGVQNITSKLWKN